MTIQTVTIASLLHEIAWTAPEGADLSGYSMEYFFDTDVHAEHATRAIAVDTALISYRGADEYGVGLDFSAVAPSLDGSGRALTAVGGYGLETLVTEGPVMIDPRPRLTGPALRRFRADIAAAESEADIWAAHARARG